MHPLVHAVTYLPHPPNTCSQQALDNRPLSLMLQLTSTMLVVVKGHASMIMPPPRNAIEATLKPWSHGKHPATGVIDPKKAPCTNGTSVCNSGQSTFWFSQGCTIGCSRCDGNGSRIANFDHCPGESIQPTLLPKYRTANRDSVPGAPICTHAKTLNYKHMQPRYHRFTGRYIQVQSVASSR